MANGNVRWWEVSKVVAAISASLLLAFAALSVIESARAESRADDAGQNVRIRTNERDIGSVQTDLRHLISTQDEIRGDIKELLRRERLSP